MGESPWLFESPGGLRNMMGWVNKRYLQPTTRIGGNAAGGAAGNPGEVVDAEPLDLYITENGCR